MKKMSRWQQYAAKTERLGNVSVLQKAPLLIAINLFYFDAKKCCLPNIKMLQTLGVFRNEAQNISVGAKSLTVSHLLCVLFTKSSINCFYELVHPRAVQR